MASKTGKAGEEYVARWLENQGFCISARNFHSRYGEIDIIAEDSQYILFVEVKTREMGAMVSPLEAITIQKQKRILLTAQLYLEERPVALQPRFDVAAVTTLHGKFLGQQYYPHAFGW